MVKVVSDQVGNQKQSEQSGGSSGYMKSSYTNAEADVFKRRHEYLGVTDYSYGGSGTRTVTATTTNLGFTDRRQ